MHRKKRILIAFIISFLAYFFWTGSRYPALNDKALMGEATPIEGLAFDEIVEIDLQDSVALKIIKNTLNWSYTNKQGMTFGLLFAAALLLLFALLNTETLKGRFSNTILGMAIGAPLGVCTNCAAPIAKGISAAGGRAETSLATMVSSPTLNVIIITMMFTLMPTYLIVIKLIFTFLLILLGIPLVTYLFPQTQFKLRAHDQESKKSFLPILDLQAALYQETDRWTTTLRWVIVNYVRSLFYLFKTTVPLMLLAGLLGSAMIEFIPVNLIPEWFSKLDGVTVVLATGLLAVVGTLLPVPMAFDVVLSATLMIAGLPEHYGMVLLFTMGTYSIYSHFIVHQSISWKTAIAMFLMVAGLGALSGGVAYLTEITVISKQRYAALATFLDNKEARPNFLRFEGKAVSIPAIDPKDIKPITFSETYIVSEENLRLSSFKFKERTSPNGKFRLITGPDTGISEPFTFSVNHMMRPLTHGGGVTSGDINRDGWPDVVFPTENGLVVYLNTGKKYFIPIASDLREIGDIVLVVALVDLNNDEWLDLFYTTYKHGNFVAFNQKGTFDPPVSVQKHPENKAAVTMAAGFSDLDNNHFLDVFQGNWTGFVHIAYPEGVFKSSENSILYNDDGTFNIEPFESIKGETLSILLSDFNDDGLIDLVEGNDFFVPDQFYLGDQQTLFKVQYRPESAFEESTFHTMSVISADIDNDLDLDIFESTVSNQAPKIHSTKDKVIKGVLKDSIDQQNLSEVLQLKRKFTEFRTKRGTTPCPEEFIDDCAAYLLMIGELGSLSQSFPKGNKFAYFQGIRDRANLIESNHIIEDHPNELKQVKESTLLINDNNRKYTRKTKEFGLGVTGWDWNAKFADLDNDQWQDLFIANGYVPNRNNPTNLFYHNQEGQGFEDQTKATGMTNYLNCSGYTYIDYDLDGDLDILMQPMFSPTLLYENELSNNHALAISLRDEKGNRMGIGAKVTISYGKDGKQHQVREMLASGGYQSFDAPIVWFGLGLEDHISDIEVRWSDGEIQHITQPLEVNRHYKIERMQGDDPQIN